MKVNEKVDFICL